MVAAHLATVDWGGDLSGTLWETRSWAWRARVGGQVETLVEKGQWWRMATSGLLHTSLTHLLTNLVLVFTVGAMLLPKVSRTLWWGTLAGGILVGNLVSQLGGIYRTDGTSGGLLAWLGLWLVLEIRADRSQAKRLILLVLVLIGVDTIVPFSNQAAHLGGLLTGVGLAFLPQAAPLFLASFAALLSWGLYTLIG